MIQPKNFKKYINPSQVAHSDVEAQKEAPA
jgi:hypothetical protein